MFLAPGPCPVVAAVVVVVVVIVVAAVVVVVVVVVVVAAAAVVVVVVVAELVVVVWRVCVGVCVWAGGWARTANKKTMTNRESPRKTKRKTGKYCASSAKPM